MITKQLIKEDDTPVAVVLDYEEYLRLKQVEEDYLDYNAAAETKKTNKNWTDHKDLKKELGIS
jgi:hypothetical protein